MKTTWIVTGASVGLGRAIVEAALAAGNNVVGTARRPETLSDLGTRHPGRFHALRLDVSDADQSRDVADATVSRFGKVDVLVNNAGFSGVGSIEDMSVDLIEEQMAIESALRSRSLRFAGIELLDDVPATFFKKVYSRFGNSLDVRRQKALAVLEAARNDAAQMQQVFEDPVFSGPQQSD